VDHPFAAGDFTVKWTEPAWLNLQNHAANVFWHVQLSLCPYNLPANAVQVEPTKPVWQRGEPA